jgi:hypothetical protein
VNRYNPDHGLGMPMTLGWPLPASVSLSGQLSFFEALTSLSARCDGSGS